MVVYKKENCNRGKKDNHVGRYHVTLVELEGVIRAKAMLLVPGSSLNGEKQCQGLGSIAMESDFLFRVRTAQGSQSSTFQDHQTHTLRADGRGLLHERPPPTPSLLQDESNRARLLRL